MALRTLDHPLAYHLLAGLRDKTTASERYRKLAKNLTTLLAIEATRGMRTQKTHLETPLEPMLHDVLDQPLAAVPILRAGLGMLEPVVELFPKVAVGYIGLERHEDTAVARSYYQKLPELYGMYTLILDPMLATGGSASQAISFCKSKGADKVVMVSILSAPEGISRLLEDHPDVEIVTAAVDRELNEKKYILPGLGDFGDRLYATSH